MATEAVTDEVVDRPRPNKQQQRTARSTRALLEAAADLIAEGGLAALTFATIGERAGYSRGLVTARFGSKDGLIDALIERIVTQWSDQSVFSQTKGCNGLDGAMTLMEAVRERASGDQRSLRVLYALMFEAIGPDDELRQRFATFHQEFRRSFADFVSEGQADGSIHPDVSPEGEAGLLVGGMRGIGYQWLLDAEGFDIVTAFDYLVETSRARLQF